MATGVVVVVVVLVVVGRKVAKEERRRKTRNLPLKVVADDWFLTLIETNVAMYIKDDKLISCVT